MRSRQERLSAYLESGLRAHAQGDVGAAAAAYRQALGVAPDDADALNLMGVALLQLGQPEQAVDCLQRAAHRLRDNADVLGNLAQAHFALGHYETAHAAFRKASRLDPRKVQFQLGAANSLAMQGRFSDAEVLLRRQAGRFPNAALVWFNLANAVRDQGRYQEAVELYRRAAGLDSNLVDARNNLGSALHTLKRFEEAEREYRACVAMAPDYAPAQCNLASVVIDLGRFGEAEQLCREMINRTPAAAQPYTLLGAALGHQGRLLEALECHRIAAELAPQDAQVAEVYASGLTETGRFDEGLRWFSRALALNPGSLTAHQLLGTALLSQGCLADGWVEYGYRPAFGQFRHVYPNIRISRTLPPELRGKPVCVLSEQGLGDEVFFLRYAPQLSASGARITYRASNKIKSLFARIACIEQVLDETAPLPEAETVILAGDLPHALSVRPVSSLPQPPVVPSEFRRQDFPRRISLFWPPVPPSLLIRPLEDKITDLRKRLVETGDPPYLGLTWRGGIPPSEQRGAAWSLYKEIGIPSLAAVLKDIPGTFIALQRNPEPGEIAALSEALGRPVHDFTALNEDLEAMLALLSLVDEYVGVSNTNMHLRAAAGRTARVLIPCPAEWRWMASGAASPWFPGFSIYRQSPRGDWDAALAALKQDLAKTYRTSKDQDP